MTHQIVSHEEWLKARKAFLEKEKAFTKAREDLARERRELPWVRIDKAYSFEGIEGPLTLADLFGKHGQLIVQHFMFGPDWNEGCPSCSFWSDNYNGIDGHLAARDTAFVLVSRGAARQARGLQEASGLDVPLGLVGRLRLQLRFRRVLRQGQRRRWAELQLRDDEGRRRGDARASAPSAAATMARSTIPIRPTGAASTC